MDIHEAVHRLHGKFPPDVESVLHLVNSGGSSAKSEPPPEYSEASLQKARVILNEMVQNSWADLDAASIECKEFAEKNRQTFGQVGNDMKRISSELSDFRRQHISASGHLEELTLATTTLNEQKGKIELSCHTQMLEKTSELQLKQNDLAVFDFILQATKCLEDSGVAFLQRNGSTVPAVQVCTTKTHVELHFGDPKQQAKLDALLTPEARKTLHKILQDMTVGRSFLQLRSGQEPEPVPVQDGPEPDSQWKKCLTGEPDCGLLHDTMSMQWGIFRDLVDELKFEMLQDSSECKASISNINEQLVIVGTKKTAMLELLAEAVSQIQQGLQSRDEKAEQYRELEKEYKKRMHECKSHLEEILYTNICAVKQVRDNLMSYSTSTPPDSISDCDVEDWKAAACSEDCDDACPNEDPYKCGGWQTLTRGVVLPPNSFGIQCPALEMRKKCNQFKCSVDCEVSEWSGWSGCSADCEGGEQQRSRAVLQKPRDGGQECDATIEARACNTDSCDRDCTLSAWEEWSPCSMACGGGMQERTRKVVVPIRALGKCPKEDHPDRLEHRACNTVECVGDEVCNAKQDLIVAIDGSGSLRASGFEIIRSFAANLTSRYQSKYQGADAMRVGVLLFGQGALQADGTITGADEVHALTADIAAARAAIEGLKWQRGITNMAQAFALAGRMLREGGRADAQSAVMVVSDGKPSMKFVARQKVQELKAKGAMVYMAPIAEFTSEELDSLKQWATQPWETNYDRIPGLVALKSNLNMFTNRLIAKFCPMAFSPAMNQAKARADHYLLIREDGYPDHACCEWDELGAYSSVQDCFEAVKEYGFFAFTYVHSGRHEGTCYVEHIDVTEALWNKWLANTTEPECPGGGWEKSPYEDTYVIDPGVKIALG